MVFFVEVVVPLGLESGKGGEKRVVGIVQYLEVTESLGAVKKNLGCICIRCSRSGKIDHSLYGKQLENLCEGWEWYGIENVSSIMRSAHLVRSKPSVHTFTTDLP